MNGGVLIGLYGGILGGVLGLLGGVYGTYRSYRAANGPKERRGIISFALCAWLFVAAYVVLIFLVPIQSRWLLTLFYSLLLPLGVFQGIKRLNTIRESEKQEK